MRADASRLERLYREAIALFDAGDWDAMESQYAPDAVAISPEGWPESGELVGWDAIRTQYERLKDGWESDSLEILSVDVKGNEVAGTVRWSGVSRSGVPFELIASQLVEYRDELIVRAQFFLDPEAASRVAGGR
jgi:ketosteroid isomerase-like protein